MIISWYLGPPPYICQSFAIFHVGQYAMRFATGLSWRLTYVLPCTFPYVLWEGLQYGLSYVITWFSEQFIRFVIDFGLLCLRRLAIWFVIGWVQFDKHWTDDMETFFPGDPDPGSGLPTALFSMAIESYWKIFSTSLLSM